MHAQYTIYCMLRRDCLTLHATRYRKMNEDTSGAYFHRDVGVQAVASITSALSVLGSLLIILLYVCVPDLRTTARYILVHLSIADFCTALSNLVGEVAMFDKYYNESTHNFTTFTMERLCIAQAFSAIYFTLSSCLWTLNLAFYMYILIMSRKTNFTKLFLWFSYIFGYGIPLLISLWLVCTKRLGYAPYNSAGWCTVISYRPQVMISEGLPENIINSNGKDRYGTFFGYDLWIVLTCCLILVIYTSVHSYIRLELKNFTKLTDNNTAAYWEAMQKVDYKFIIIPLVFILLRVWSIISNVLLVYGVWSVNNFPYWLVKVLFYLMGIGDSGQGFLNALLFIFSTSNARVRLVAILTCSNKCYQGKLPMFNDSSLQHKVAQQSYKQIQHQQQEGQNSDESSPLYNSSFGDKQSSYKRSGTAYGTHSPAQQLVSTSASFSTANLSQTE